MSLSPVPLAFSPKNLHLPELGLHLDPHRPTPWAFVSHGHADHFARHEKVLCTPATGLILRRRYRLAAERIQTLPFGETLEIKNHRITLHPAGHITGSAMIRVETDGESLLYTGDFKTRPSLTAETSEFPQADILIMETTFGKPEYVFPPNAEIHRDIRAFVREAIEEGETPVLYAYSLGKAQEAYALLAAENLPVVLQKNVHEMTLACLETGLLPDLPEPILFEKTVPPGHALIAPPNAVRSHAIRRLKNTRTAVLTGWAMNPAARYRYQVDAAFPLSDHADFPGLLEAVERVNPMTVHTLHGSTREFAAELRTRGREAWSIYGDDQLELLGSAEPRLRPTSPQKSLSRPDSQLHDLSALFESLTATSSRLKKTELLATFLRPLDPETLAVLIPWLAGQGVLQIGTALVRQALLETSGAPLADYKSLSASQNDAARTTRLLLENHPAHLRPEPHTFLELAASFQDLAAAKGSLKKASLLAALLTTSHPAEAETIVRLLSGGLRSGVKEGLLEDALAAAFETPPAELRRAHMMNGDLVQTALLAKEKRLTEAAPRPGHPLKAMLASPSADAEAILAWHAALASEEPLWTEPKHDGIRAQLHVTDSGPHLFSRDLRPLDDEFPEILGAAKNLPPCILDGELIAFAEGKKLTFFDLQKRLGRKKAQGDLFLGASIPVKFVAFDLLHLPDQPDLSASPLRHRRAELEKFNLKPPFELITLHHPADLSGLETAFKKSLDSGWEGLIAKDPASAYQPGRRGKSWMKLKGVMPTLDCVVIAAQQGHGRRAGVLSDYTFAIRDQKTGVLLTLGKAYSGLTDQEIEELTEHFQRTTVEKISSRVHRVQPEIVLEIAFDSIRPSKRHDSGLALRFPRIEAIRRDKTPAEIDTLQTARKLV